MESADTSADSGESFIFEYNSDESNSGSQDSGSEYGSDGHGSLSGSPVEYDATCISENSATCPTLIFSARWPFFIHYAISRNVVQLCMTS